MFSSDASLMIIAICQMVFAFIGIVVAAALIYAIFAFKGMISQKVDEAMAKVQPVMDRAESIAQQAKETADKVSEKMDAIATKAEVTADKVGDRVQAVSEKVESAVNPQLVTVAGLVGAAAKCFQIYQDYSKLKQEGSNGSKTSVSE